MNKSLFLLLIGGIFALMVAMGIGRFAYTPVLPLMQEALHFSDAMAGYLASSNYAGYFVGAMLTGVLPLKRNKMFYLRSGLVASMITTCMMGLTHSYPLMLFIRLISGMASALIFVAASSMVLDRLAAAGKTSYSGYFYSGVGLGIFFSTLLIPSVNEWFGWEGVWVGLSIFSGILTIFAWLWINDSSNGEFQKEEPTAITPGPPLRWIPWLIIAYGLEGLGYIVTGTFMVSIAEKTAVFRFDPAMVWVVVGLGAVPSCILWSTFAKKRGFVKALVFSMALQAVGIALPVFRLSPTGLMASALLFGATFMGITTLATTLARQMSPSNSSRIIGYLTAVYAAGQMAGPTIAGLLLSHTQSFHSALLGAAGAVFIGAVLLASGIRFDRMPGRSPGGSLFS